MIEADMHQDTSKDPAEQKKSALWRRYRKITSAIDTTYHHHDEPGLMAISLFRARANAFNEVISDLKLLSKGEKVFGVSQDDYPGFEKDDYDQLIKMLQNEELLLLDTSQQVEIPEDIGNDLSDIEELDKVKHD